MFAPHGSPEGGSSALPCYAATDDEPFRIPDDHLPGVLEGLAQMRRGEFATDEEMDALWKKCGL